MKQLTLQQKTLFIEQLKASIEAKIQLCWSREVSAGFTATDIVGVFEYFPYSGTFRLLLITDIKESDAHLCSFLADETEPTILNLRESEELLKWVRENEEKEVKNMFTLDDVISGRCFNGSEWVNHEFSLTDTQKEAFVKIVGHGCRQQTKDMLWRFIEVPTAYPSCHLYRRVVFNQNRIPCQYVAGMSMPDELREIRKFIAKGC